MVFLVKALWEAIPCGFCFGRGHPLASPGVRVPCPLPVNDDDYRVRMSQTKSGAPMNAVRTPTGRTAGAMITRAT